MRSATGLLQECPLLVLRQRKGKEGDRGGGHSADGTGRPMRDVTAPQGALQHVPKHDNAWTLFIRQRQQRTRRPTQPGPAKTCGRSLWDRLTILQLPVTPCSAFFGEDTGLAQ